MDMPTIKIVRVLVPGIQGPAGPPGPGLTDGDKGDIVVSGGGLSWLIDSNVLSPFGRSLIDDADNTSARATLGAAPLASPVFSGNPQSITPPAGDNDLSIATSAFVQGEIAVEGVVNIRRFGAVGDGSTDDTTAIANALTYALANNRALLIPEGTFVVSGSGAAIFTVTRPIEIFGHGHYSFIKVASGVPSTRDVFLYTGTADAGASGATYALFRDFRIEGTGAAPGSGRHAINITTPTNAYSFRMGIERMEVNNISGYAVWADQSATSTSVHTSWIKDSRFLGDGFGGVSLYDSWVIENCQLAGIGYAVNFTSVVGAGKFTLKDCNITASSGVKIGGAAGGHANLLLDNNYFETVNAYDGDSGAYVNLAGASGFLLLGPMVMRNIITILGGKNDPNGLRLDYTRDAVIAGNWFNIAPATAYAVKTTANTINTYIAPSNIYSSPGAGRLSDSGNNTSGGSKYLAILNADSTALSNFTAITAFDKVYVIKANYLRPGQMVRVRAAGRFSVTGTPVLTVAVRIGGQVIASAGLTTASGISNATWTMSGQAVFRGVGTTTVVRSTDMQFVGNAGNNGNNLTLNTFADLTIDATAAWSVADALNIITMTQLTVEVIDAPTIN